MASSKDFSEIISQILPKYRDNFTLRPLQKEVLEYVYNKESHAIVSAPTGSGKSVIFHLIGKILWLKRHDEPGCHITLLIAPLNIIQADQLKSLRAAGISACKLDIEGHGSCLTPSEDCCSSEECQGVHDESGDESDSSDSEGETAEKV